MRILKLAEDFELSAKILAEPDPNIVIEEHKDVSPKSYMAAQNLHNLIKDSQELIDLLNEQDDLPQWVDELLAISKHNVAKALSYVRGEKSQSTNNSIDKSAQYRGFLSSVKSLWNKPKSELEEDIILLDEELRDLYLAHGYHNQSLDDDLKMLGKFVKEQKWQKAKMILIDFYDCLEGMEDKISDFLDAEAYKTAGFFDMFKSKPESELDKLLKSQFFKVLEVAKKDLSDIKNIFNMLDKHRGNLDLSAYFESLYSLRRIILNSVSQFKSFELEYFDLIDGGIHDAKKQMSKELGKQPFKQDDFKLESDKFKSINDPVEDRGSYDKKEYWQSNLNLESGAGCPCGSHLPWIACHGKDEDKIEKIMMDKNISYEEAEQRYFKWVNLHLGKLESQKSKKEEDYREQFNKIYEQFKDQLAVGDLDKV